jgi:hypothetical protein
MLFCQLLVSPESSIPASGPSSSSVHLPLAEPRLPEGSLGLGVVSHRCRAAACVHNTQQQVQLSVAVHSGTLDCITAAGRTAHSAVMPLIVRILLFNYCLVTSTKPLPAAASRNRVVYRRYRRHPTRTPKPINAPAAAWPWLLLLPVVCWAPRCPPH